MLNYILVFISVIFVDIAWTYYLITVQERKPVKAGFWAAVIYLLGAYVVILYNQDHSYIFIAAITSFIGTSLTVMFKKIVEKDKDYFKNIFKKYGQKSNCR